MQTSKQYCLDLLRRRDPDHYLSVLYLPDSIRYAAAALYAFNIEIAQIPGLVSEPAAGEVRLQWWREVLTAERDHGNQPVAIELLRTIEAFQLPVAMLQNYLDARIFDLYHDPMPDLQTLETYAGETSSILLRLILFCQQSEMNIAEREAADACGHGGVALTFTTILQSLSPHRAARRCYLPVDLLASVGLNVSQWLDDPPDDRHINAVSALSGLARDHYRSAVNSISRLEKAQRQIFLPLARMPRYLNYIQKLQSKIFLQPFESDPLIRQYDFGRAAIFGLPST
jgi:15-cis-phytoene synthase